MISPKSWYSIKAPEDFWKTNPSLTYIFHQGQQPHILLNEQASVALELLKAVYQELQKIRTLQENDVYSHSMFAQLVMLLLQSYVKWNKLHLSSGANVSTTISWLDATTFAVCPSV